MTAFQFTGLIDFKDALSSQSPFSLFLRSVPALFILIFLFFLTSFIYINVSKVKVATKNCLGFLEGSAERGFERNYILFVPKTNAKSFFHHNSSNTHASVYPENFLPRFFVMGWPSSSTIKSFISVVGKDRTSSSRIRVNLLMIYSN